MNTEKDIFFTLILTLILTLTVLSGCTADKKENIKENIATLKIYGGKTFSGIKPFNYSSVPAYKEVIFNGYRIRYEILANNYIVETPAGVKYRAVVLESPSSQKEIGKAKIMIVKMIVEKTNEKGIEPQKIKEYIWLPPIIPFPAKKEYTATAFTTYLGFGDSVARYWNYNIDPNTRYLCSFDTNTTIEKAYGVCMFVYPEIKEPKDLVVAAGGRVAIARVPLT